MKKVCVLMIAALMTVLLSACSLGLDISENIHPPRANGEQSEIQKALETYAGKGIKLIYPSNGEYRSAITTEDIDGDGVFEAFAFYGTKADDKSNVVHLNFIKKTENGWISVSDITKNVAGVEAVEFIDVGDGNLRSLVKWQGFTALDGLISMFEASQGTLLEVYCHPCSEYINCDITGDGKNEIIELYCNADEKTSSASCISYGENGFDVTSACTLDGGVTSYEKPVLTRLKNGAAAVYVDAVKSTGYITEILTVREEELHSAFTVGNMSENTRTFRKTTVLSADIDGDGSFDIPLAEPLPVSSGETVQSHLNVWHSYDGLAFTPIAYSLINYTDGYTIFIPESLVGNFTLSRDTDLRLRVFCRWEQAEGKTAEEIFRIRVFTVPDWESGVGVPEGYFEVARNEESVFAVNSGNSALTPEKSFIMNNFKLITQKEEAYR